MFPTKVGVVFTPARFRALIMGFGQIERMYSAVVEKKSGPVFSTMHISGGIYATVHLDNPTMSLCCYFRNEDGQVLPTNDGWIVV